MLLRQALGDLDQVRRVGCRPVFALSVAVDEHDVFAEPLRKRQRRNGPNGIRQDGRDRPQGARMDGHDDASTSSLSSSAAINGSDSGASDAMPASLSAISLPSSNA